MEGWKPYDGVRREGAANGLDQSCHLCHMRRILDVVTSLDVLQRTLLIRVQIEWCSSLPQRSFRASGCTQGTTVSAIS